jgi:hypothetical protein
LSGAISPRTQQTKSSVEAVADDLFDVAGTASVHDFLLEFLGVFLGDAFLERLRSAFDKVFGFLEAESGCGPHDLNNGNLL